MRETYNDLDWDIDEMPIGSSTPDELFEVSFRATAQCPECGSTIHGTANYWSMEEDMSMAWLHNVDHEPCESCEEDLPDEDDDEFDEYDIK